MTPPVIVGPTEQAPAPQPQTVDNNLPFLTCSQGATQGGAVLCRTTANAALKLDGKPVAKADETGLAIIGLARAQKTPAIIAASVDGREVTASVDVAKRTDSVSNLSMTCSQISAQTPEEKKKAEDAWIKKDRALKIFSAPLAPVALVKPVAGEFPLSSSFGATRTYTPKTKDCEPTVNVHNGTDIAVPTGTEIHAPMAGTVLLADPDLYYEGGAVFLDLGRGLVNVTMHMSRIDVKAGQVVKQGELLGLSGATGRVTGPHLHWAVKYRNVNDADRGSDIWLDPVLLMQLDSTKLSAN